MTTAITSQSRLHWFLLAGSGGLLLGLSTPPAPCPGCELLVLPALMLWFVIGTRSPSPLWHGYLFGCVHLAWFSWSLRHVLLPAWFAIFVVGGFYYLLATAVTRWWPRGKVFGFAVAVAASFWLRACMPEIHYPHGQPCHSLWAIPVCLGSVTVGGEALANALLAAIAAALVGIFRSWRLASPPWRTAWSTLGLVSVVAVAVTAFGITLRRAIVGEGSLRIAAIEPGFHPADELESVSYEQQRAHFRRLLADRFVTPTSDLLHSLQPPQLVLWPESSLFEELHAADIASGNARLAIAHLRNPKASRLVLGANLETPGGSSPAAFLVDPDNGTVLGYQAKRQLVPGGEFVPWLRWLPASIAAWLRDAFAAALGSLPDCTPGVEQAPMLTAGGVPFGALLCFDNAFAEPAANQVAAGAKFLCVLSNECWYRGGAELTQLVAMSVVRALETATPLVRCTQDGWSVVVAADGHLLAELPMVVMPQPRPRILELELPLGPGRLPPLAWLRGWTGPFAAALLALVILHRFARWARLRVAPTAIPAAGGSGSSAIARGSGS